VLLVIAVLLAVFLVFRQGLVPARYTPLPRLDLENPLPLVADWQIAELRFDRELCRDTISNGAILKARQIADRPLEKGCGWINAVRMSEAGGAQIWLSQVTCQAAAAFALWVQYEVQPAAERIFGQRVAAIQNMGTYSCRNIIGSRFWKNRRSEHATANAIDVSGFRLADGTVVSVHKDWRGKGKKAEFLRAVNRGGCRFFRVTLGPDFNQAHRDHFHFDRGQLWSCN
jgi:hypothetical protein